jgi:hopanoid biosynthesis associated RND transporter like protein HpnN
MDAEPREQASLLARVLAGTVGVIGRHPWLVLAAVVLSCAACGIYTWKNLTYLTHRNDLISSNKEYLKRWRQYVEEFGDDADMVVVVQGDDRPQMEKVLDELASEIAKQPESFERLFYKADLTSLHRRALLFLPTEQIRLVQAQVQGPLGLLLKPPVIGDLDPLYGWKSLSVQQLLREGERRLEVWKTDQPTKEAEDFFKQLATISDGATDFLESPSKYRNPWRSILPEQQGPSQEEQLSKTQYFFSGDGKLAFLLVSPVKDKDPENFTYAQKSIDALRELIAGMKERHPEVEIGLTGLPVLENDEMVASQHDSSTASWLALVGIVLLYLVVYRGFRYPFMTVASLVVGTVWALGWLTLTVGHLNILSSAFAVMLIGIGDYGVLWVTRFGQERQAGRDIAEANRQTAMKVGPSVCTAALTTAFAFFAAMFADLKAVSELGWIAGCGVLLCALACGTVVPALLSIFDFRTVPGQATDDMILSLRDRQETRREWLAWLMRRPRWVMIGFGVLTLICAGYALNIQYDHNLLNLQAPQMDSVQWEKKLTAKMNDSSWYAVSWTMTPEEALAQKAKFEQLPDVSMVVTMASLLPGDQERKIEMLADIHQRLGKLPKRGEIIAHSAPNMADVKQTGERVLRILAAKQKEKPNAAMARLQISMQRLLTSIRAREGEAPAEPSGVIQVKHTTTTSSVVRSQLKQYDEQITRDLAEDLHRLRDVSTPTQIRLDDLPANLRERYIGKNGKWLVRIFSKECLWDFEPLEKFTEQVRSVEPGATGTPFTTLEGLKAMQSGFIWAGVYALIAMVLVLLLDFGGVKCTLVALMPLTLGMIATLGVMALFGCALNPANMIAFPLILGVGADNGVHVLHDFRGRDRKQRYRLTHIMGFGILVKAVTTVLGFGTLMIAQHRGMASLGLILAVGVTCCMLTALVFLPALLHVMGGREKKAVEPVMLPMAEREAA